MAAVTIQSMEMFASVWAIPSILSPSALGTKTSIQTCLVQRVIASVQGALSVRNSHLLVPSSHDQQLHVCENPCKTMPTALGLMNRRNPFLINLNPRLWTILQSLVVHEKN
jgi:hypothetical protein